VVALQQLGRLDTVYALSCVQALATGKVLKPSVLAAAQAVLAEAAARRGMALADLSDELTPDFDLGRGVQLQVGAQTYDVLLQGDLSLRLRTPAGKLVRSLPALADEALRPQWEAAAARLKTLAKGIKAVLQQQAGIGRWTPGAACSWSTRCCAWWRKAWSGGWNPQRASRSACALPKTCPWSMPRAMWCNCPPRPASPCGTPRRPPNRSARSGANAWPTTASRP
jgi:hypothetical protein